MLAALRYSPTPHLNHKSTSPHVPTVSGLNRNTLSNIRSPLSHTQSNAHDTYTHANTHKRAHTCARTETHKSTRTLTRKHTRTRTTCFCLCMHASMKRASMQACVHACKHTHTHSHDRRHKTGLFFSCQANLVHIIILENFHAAIQQRRVRYTS